MAVPFSIIDLVLHFDQYLLLFIHQFGFWVYLILFLILFCETGLVIAPFLPGDSLLFIAGTFAGTGILNIWVLWPALVIAVILGDTVNYWIGYTFELKVLEWRYCAVKKEHLQETHDYFEKYGGFTIVIARFMPFIRTFAPFLAGIGRMRYSWFLGYNVLGGLLWVGLFLFGGFLFGNIPVVQQHFTLIVYAIIAISVLAFAPVVVRILWSMKKEKAGKTGE
jgi:membrane-associated protein